MRYTLLFASAVAALISHLDIGTSYLERRLIRYSQPLERRMIRKKGKNITTETGSKKMIVVPPESITPKNARAKGSAKEGDTYAMAKLTGPGQIGVGRHSTQQTSDTALVSPGQRITKETHDPTWSKAVVQALGDPRPGERAYAHPAKVEGIGKTGKVEVNPPERGFGTIKKEVNNQVVHEERVRGGQPGIHVHNGENPGEVKLYGSTSRGGDATVRMTNENRRM